MSSIRGVARCYLRPLSCCRQLADILVVPPITGVKCVGRAFPEGAAEVEKGQGEGMVDVPCPDLLMQLSDDQFPHILSMISLRGLVSLRIISKSTTARIDELCLQIPGFGARLFAYVPSTHRFLDG